MFTSIRFSTTVLIVVAFLSLILAAADSTRAETYVVDGVLEWVWVPARSEVVRTYQGRSWVWSPTLGWQRHDYWSYASVAVPGHWAQRVRMLDVFSR